MISLHEYLKLHFPSVPGPLFPARLQLIIADPRGRLCSGSRSRLCHRLVEPLLPGPRQVRAAEDPSLGRVPSLWWCERMVVTTETLLT